MIHMSRSCATAALAALLFACVDPAGQLDDFSNRVIDAGEVIDIDAAEVDEVPNATGTFLLGLSAYLDPDSPFVFLTEVEVEAGDEGVTLNLSAQPLRADNLEPIGDPLVITNVPVSTTAEFDGIFSQHTEGSCNPPAPDDAVEIPGAANPISGSALTLAATLHGELVSENAICGEVTGCEYQLEIPLDGSTFALIRIDPESDPADYPDPVGSCANLPDGNGDE
jgi:hypothetical protein